MPEEEVVQAQERQTETQSSQPIAAEISPEPEKPLEHSSDEVLETMKQTRRQVARLRREISKLRKEKDSDSTQDIPAESAAMLQSGKPKTTLSGFILGRFRTYGRRTARRR